MWLIAFYLFLTLISGTTAQIWTNGQGAYQVIGQSSFTSCAGGLSSTTLSTPRGVVVDRNNRKLWVADAGNHRLLRYSLDSLSASNSAAELVLGQSSFTTSVTNYPMAGQVNNPGGLWVDNKGGLWMADISNNRVLYWAQSHLITTNGQSANKVIGQADFNSVQPNRVNAGPSANGLWAPFSVLVDPMDNLWIADFENSRVVRYPNILAGVSAVGTTGGELSANLVFGQPTLTFAVRNNQPINFTLTDVYGLAWAGNSLFISDGIYATGRIVRMDNPNSKSNGAVFSGVIGQATVSSAISYTSPTSQTVPTSLGLTDDGQGGLFVANDGFDRVLYFPAPSSDTNDPVASVVLGQPNFITAVSGQCAQTTLSTPFAVAYDPDTCLLFVADYILNRVTSFQAANCTARPIAFSVTNTAQPNSNLQTVFQVLPPNSQTPMEWITDTPPTWQDYGVVPPGGFGIGQAIPEYYTTPQAGWYHFDATVLLLLAFSSEETGYYQYTPLPPNGNVDIRLTTACNTTSTPWACDCTQQGLAQAGATYLASGSLRPPANPTIGAFVPGAPNYSLAISWTGKLPALTNVGVCVDNWTGQDLELLCLSNGLCNFSGFLVH